jgi:hypothetical protein
MYILIIHKTPKSPEREYCGPFPTADRARKYAYEFPDEWVWVIQPIIIPHCVYVRTNY